VSIVNNCLHLLGGIQGKKTTHVTLSHVRLTFQTRVLKFLKRSDDVMEKPTNNTNTIKGTNRKKERNNE
jgi:hypothetical protein